MKGMIGGLNKVERCLPPEPLADGADELEVGERVSRALQEKHGGFDLGQMIGALYAGLVRRMQRKSKEDDALDSGQKAGGRGLRTHATSHGLAASEEWQVRGFVGGRVDGGFHRGGEDIRAVGSAAAIFHVRKLVAEDGDGRLRELGGQAL